MAAFAIGIFVKLTTGRGPLEAFVTMVANRSKRAVIERALIHFAHRDD